MKTMKKMMAVLIAMVMTLAMGVTVFAQTVEQENPDADNATITINNPAKGETYSIYKLFDATVSGDKIAYQSTEEIPEGLKTFFTKDDSNNVLPTAEIKDGENTKMTDDLKAALETWANTQTPTATAESNGSKLEFTGLPYGYYVMVTSHKSDPEGTAEAKSAITVTSTQPNAAINDKNVNNPSADKIVEQESYSIGDTVKYTATFVTTNYMGEGENAKQVINYLIEDTLPEFLSNEKVTKITIGGTEYTVNGEVPQFEEHIHNDACKNTEGAYVCGYDQKKGIMIKWADAVRNDEGAVTGYTSLYDQGAKIIVEYTAVLTSTTNIGSADTNTVSIRPFVDNGDDTPDGGDPWDEKWEDKVEIKTYAAAIKKVDEKKQPLAGAEFTIAGLTVEKLEDGVYKVVSYDKNSTTASATLVTDNQGKLYIVGLAENVKLTVTETKAPDGYNKLTETKELPAQKLSTTIYETSGEKHYDKDGNLVSESVTGGRTETHEKNLDELDVAAVEIINNQGSLLPSTGGIGTTIFYIVGAVLVIGAAVLLVTKKRMSKEA